MASEADYAALAETLQARLPVWTHGPDGWKPPLFTDNSGLELLEHLAHRYLSRYGVDATSFPRAEIKNGEALSDCFGEIVEKLDAEVNSHELNTLINQMQGLLSARAQLGAVRLDRAGKRVDDYLSRLVVCPIEDLAQTAYDVIGELRRLDLLVTDVPAAAVVSGLMLGRLTGQPVVPSTMVHALLEVDSGKRVVAGIQSELDEVLRSMRPIDTVQAFTALGASGRPQDMSSPRVQDWLGAIRRRLGARSDRLNS